MANESYVFKFTRTPDFIDNMNRAGCFDVAEMDGTTKNYQFEIASDCPSDINDCLNDDGTLKRSKVTIANIGDTGQVALTFSKGISNDRTISLGASAVTLDVGDIDVHINGIFLVDMNTDYVLAYCILARNVPVSNEVILPANGMVWNIRNEI